MRENHPVKYKHFDDDEDEPGKVRCRFCGTINDTTIRDRGDGYGGNISYPTMTGGSNQRNPTVGGAGCVFCGSSNGW